MSTQDAEEFPRLNADAYIGLAGEIIRKLEPETEADSAGMLVSFLTAFGNAVGPHPKFEMSDATHYANLFVALIGDTASGKGRAWSIIETLFWYADLEWADSSIESGLSSGEGLVDRIKDDEDSSPKSLMIIESEFARPLTAMRREGNTLSTIIRDAWDHKTLNVLTRGKSRIRATNPHVSMLVQCTPEELEKLTKDKIETANGFSNRFLWACVRRSKELPEGGRHNVHEELSGTLQDAILKAREIRSCWRDEDAKALWAEEYSELTASKPGPYGKATSRAHAQTLRLSMLYALLDGTNIIGVQHLKAALVS